MEIPSPPLKSKRQVFLLCLWLKQLQVSLFHVRKVRGQIFIEGICFLIIFFGFLFSIIQLEKAVEDQIHKASLKPVTVGKRRQKQNRRKEFPFQKVFKWDFK